MGKNCLLLYIAQFYVSTFFFHHRNNIECAEAFILIKKSHLYVQVNVKVDYIKPAQDSFPEKMCCTVMREDV